LEICKVLVVQGFVVVWVWKIEVIKDDQYNDDDSSLIRFVDGLNSISIRWMGLVCCCLFVFMIAVVFCLFVVLFVVVFFWERAGID